MHDEELFFDTTVLSNFARIERLPLLWKFSSKINTTKEVIEEIEKGIIKRPQLSTILAACERGGIRLSSTINEETILLMNGLRIEGVLGKGEISLIGVAKETHAIFVTDDKEATNKAQKLGIKILDAKEYRSTVTILKALLKDGHIEKKEYDEIQKLLKDNSFIFLKKTNAPVGHLS